MAEYSPPIEDLPIFDASVFITEDTELVNKLKNKFVRYPTAQGNNTLQSVQVNGSLNVNGSSTLNGSSTQVALNIKDNTANRTTQISQISNEFRIQCPANNSSTIRLIAGNGPNIDCQIGNTGFVINNRNLVLGTSSGITFADGKIQQTSFTGWVNSPGTFSNANITLDNSGKITAISSGNTSISSDLITIVPTSPSNPSTSGIVNNFNQNGYNPISSSNTSGINTYCYMYNIPTYDVSNANYIITLEYYIFQQSSNIPYFNKGKIIIYPTRIPNTSFYVGYLNNAIDNNYNFVYTGTNAPNGRWLWNTDFNYVNLPNTLGPNILISKSGSGNLTLTLSFGIDSAGTNQHTDGYIKILSRDENLSSSGIELSNTFKSV